MRSAIWWIPMVERACRALLWMAPASYRDARSEDIVATTLAVCRTARRDRGRLAFIVTLWSESIDLAWSIVRLRTGFLPSLTTGLSQPLRRDHGETFMAWIGQDLRLAVRGLAAGRMTTAIVLTTLALGIGINAAVFSVLDSILWRPVPFAEASRLVTLVNYNEKGHFTFRGQMTSRLVTGWRAETDIFDRVEAYEPRFYIYADGQGSDLLQGAIVTPALIPMLGVRPALGRLFTDGDGRSGSADQVIVSDRFWRERLHRDAAAVGRTIVLDGVRHEVVGVMPAWFRFPDDQHEFWLPYDVAQPPANSPRESLVPLARFQRGVARALLEKQVTARGSRLNNAAGLSGSASARAMNLGGFDSRTERSLLVLGGAVSFLLLIVCANVTNLVLSRSLPRRRDAAIRMALGASRRDIARETLVEHVLLGVLGAGAGVFVAKVAIAAVLSVLPQQMTFLTLNPIDLDARALAFLAAVSTLCIVACGVPAALTASRASVAHALATDSRSSVGSAAARRVRATLVVVEIALSIVLLVGAALMTRSLLRLQAVDIGLDPARLVTMQLGLPAPAYSSPFAREAVTTDLLARLHLDRSVTGASAGDLPPKSSMVLFGQLEFSDRPQPEAIQSFVAVYGTWPEFFRTAGIRLVQGHDFAASDPENPAIVSDGFARQYFADRPPLGLRFRLAGGTWRTIVGVASEVHSRSDSGGDDALEVYYPHDHVTDVARVTRQTSSIADYVTVVVRAVNVDAAMTALPRVAHDVDPRIVVSKVIPVERTFADDIARPRIVFLMMSVFAGFGLVLAAAGLYGVLACLVMQRLRELGIRLALGARPADLGRLILGSGLRLTAGGLAIGIVLALALVRTMRTLLYEVEPFDLTSMMIVSALLLCVAIAASWIPARRAMKVDPVTLLRE